MNESRFIELLNLYVDHQLSSTEAAELEAEILRNAKRRQMYQQYCRMQKACTLLFEQELSHAPTSATLSASLSEADRKIIAFPKSKPRSRRAYYPIGMVAVAACAAFVFVRTTRTDDPAKAPLQVVTAPVPSAPVEAVQVVTIPPAVAPALNSGTGAPASFYSVFATRRLGNAGENKASSFSSDNSVTPAVSYSWMRDVEFAPVPSLSPNRLVLQSSSMASADERVIRSSKPVQSKAPSEINAFQFQR